MVIFPPFVIVATSEKSTFSNIYLPGSLLLWCLFRVEPNELVIKAPEEALSSPSQIWQEISNMGCYQLLWHMRISDFIYNIDENHIKVNYF